MAFTETVQTGFGGRIGRAFFGIIIGLILAIAAGALLFWNEGRTVKRHRDLQAGAEQVITIESTAVVPGNEGKLVHMIGETATDTPLADAEFGIEEQAVKLIRDAEMFQWVEDKKTRTEGSGSSKRKVTEYHYEKKWESRVIDSAHFKEQSGHQNPRTMKYQSQQQVAQKVMLDAFRLPDFLVSKINKSEPVAMPNLDRASAAVQAEGKLAGDEVYFGENPNDPQIGDVRVSFKAVRTGTTSIVAQQAGETFAKFQAANGTIELLHEGTASAQEMFQQAESQNSMIAWAIRAGGFVGMGIGLSMLFGPLVLVANFIPFLGGIVGRGTAIIAFLFAGIFSSVIIAVAWIAYRPLIGIGVLVLTAACVVLLVKAVRKRKLQQQGTTPAPPPPLPSTPPPLDLN
ncbi:MAG: TMEM43 family protein [Verrucomicrobiae bacterium]|nr:TMEM43 family protein [Verrucomicrobiae bacterium]